MFATFSSSCTRISRQALARLESLDAALGQLIAQRRDHGLRPRRSLRPDDRRRNVAASNRLPDAATSARCTARGARWFAVSRWMHSSRSSTTSNAARTLPPLTIDRPARYAARRQPRPVAERAAIAHTTALVTFSGVADAGRAADAGDQRRPGCDPARPEGGVRIAGRRTARADVCGASRSRPYC